MTIANVARRRKLTHEESVGEKISLAAFDFKSCQTPLIAKKVQFAPSEHGDSYGDRRQEPERSEG